MLAYLRIRLLLALKQFVLQKTAFTKFFIWAVILFFSLPVYAQVPDLTGITPQSILKNISDTIPNLMRLVTAFAYVLGMFMIISGIMKLKHAGEMRTMMSREHSLNVPLVQIFFGAMLLYLPTAVQIGLSTFWTNPNPYGYVEQQDQWAQFMSVLFLVIQFIGVVAFIRGLVILSHAAGGHQQGGIGKGLTHIIGGIFCINIYQFIQVVFATIGVEI